MKVLLDTNVLVRILNRDALPRAATRILDKPGTELIVSMVTPWEIAMKPMLGLTQANVRLGIDAIGATTLPLGFSHLERYAALPVHLDHKDPFDRMLIAQALDEQLTVMTSGTRFEEYSGLKIVWD